MKRDNVKTGAGSWCGRQPFLTAVLIGCLVTLGSVAAQAGDSSRFPLKRAIASHDFSDLGLRVSVDASPAWAVELAPNPSGKYSTVVARSPANFYPLTEMQFTHIPDLRLKDLGANRKARVIHLLRQLARLYKIPSDAIQADNLLVEYHGRLSGFSLVVNGVANGAADIKFFLGQGERLETGLTHLTSRSPDAIGQGMIFIAVVTQTGAMPALKQVIRRSWSNTGYLTGTQH